MADRRLQVFHAVAKQLSFTKAAEALYMTQPAVTFQIKQLEEHFNTRLFDRGHGRIALTPAGDLVLEYAERILGQYADLEAQLAEMTGQMRGPLLVGATITIAEFMLPRVLGEFNTLFPQVRARLSVGNSETIENRIIEHSLDIGLTEATEHLPGLEVEKCSDDELQVICAPSHPLAKLQEIQPAMLLEHAFISREAGSGTREVTDNYFRKAGISPDSLKALMELGSPEALKGVVSTGLGFAIVSRASVDKERQLKQLVAIPLKPRLTRSLSLVYPKEKFRSKLVSSFVDFARKKLQEYSV
ncbi:MAG TPA: LysR family transcriptional regulator [Azospira sp.]|nr:LysR family transcriptional regulator [Azospira sp.]